MRLPPSARPATRNSPSGRPFEPGVEAHSIVFKGGWDDPENSDVQAYTKQGATAYLSSYSDELATMISKSSCVLNVTKGCHQANDRHFTLNGVGSKRSCKSIYAGSKSIHIPC